LRIKDFFRDESGVSTLEYVVGAVAIAALGVYFVKRLMLDVEMIDEVTRETIYADYYKTKH